MSRRCSSNPLAVADFLSNSLISLRIQNTQNNSSIYHKVLFIGIDKTTLKNRKKPQPFEPTEGHVLGCDFSRQVVTYILCLFDYSHVEPE